MMLCSSRDVSNQFCYWLQRGAELGAAEGCSNPRPHQGCGGRIKPIRWTGAFTMYDNAGRGHTSWLNLPICLLLSHQAGN